MNDDRRFKTCHAGRRSYKTELGKRTVVVAALTTPGEAFFLGAPTRDQAKRIFWDDIKALVPAWIVRDLSETQLRITLKNRAEIWIIGFDKPARFEGKRWKGGLLTEFPHFKPTAWDQTIMPVLRDTKGWAIIEGVPEGAGDVYQELCSYEKAGRPGWADYSWKSIEVMDRQEVEEERARLDERTFRQEYEGTFESYEGKVYCYYDVDRHEKELPFDSHRPIGICCDFNINPCVWEMTQDTPMLTYFFDEICQRQTDVWKMCTATKERIRQYVKGDAHIYPIIFYGDYTSTTRRDVSQVASTWQIIRDEFDGWNVNFRLKSNPRIIDRINAVNSRMRSADGQIHLAHSKRCVELRKDFMNVDMKMLTQNKDAAGDRTHASDAAGYMINYLYPIQKITVEQQLSRKHDS